MAICDTFNCLSYQWQVRFISLCDRKVVLSYSFESKVLSVDANDRFVIVMRTDSITVLAACTLSECYTITRKLTTVIFISLDVKPILWPNLLPKSVPSSLGVRWLAFADSKPVYQHLSRCGDGSTDESQPLTTTVLSMNKRLWDGISALANSVVSNSLVSNSPTSSTNHLSPQSQPPQSSSPDSFQRHKSGLTTSEFSDSNGTISPGYVTIVDLHTLNSEFELRKLEKYTTSIHLCRPLAECNDMRDRKSQSYSVNNEHANIVMSGTKYLNVHEFGGSGAIVAHFMAHRWANVALLKFDPSGSLLFTACKRGHSFNLFRIANHPFDQRQTAVHHLYILERGNLPCEVMDATFSRDSRWVAVSSNHGTTHVFPITAYGGPITVRTHTRPHVVNRTSRYHRSSGLEEHHLTRPQPGRNASESTVFGNNPSNKSTNTLYPIPQTGSLKHSYASHVQSFDLTSDMSNTTSSFCQTAPIAGFAPQCPHLGFTSVITPLSENTLSRMGEHSIPSSVIDSNPSLCDKSISQSSITSSKPLPSEASASHLHVPGSASFISEPPNMLLASSEGLCACPPNALYNSTNSRLPPYPEPCRVKPEARLKPSSGNTMTSVALGCAGSALEAVTPLAGTNTPLIHRNTSPVKPCCCSPNSLHCTGMCAHTQSPIAASVASRSVLHSRKQHRRQRNCQSLQSADQDMSSPTNSCVRAARFGPPVCFLPNQFRLNNLSSNYRTDPYVGKSRAVDALFILTADLRLIEYDLCVSPADTATVGGKLYQDGSIRLDCVAVGEWNLHTDAVYLPPFPKQHPLISASCTLQARCKMNKSRYDHSPIASYDRSGIASELVNNSGLSTAPSPSKLSLAQNNDSNSLKAGILEVNTDNTENDDNDEDKDDNIVTPAGWTAEDVASYWYSQVEITTHLGPLRRVWMGPQFTFRNYSKQRDWSGCDLQLSSLNSSDNDNLPSNSQMIIKTSGNMTSALHPTLVEAFTLNTPSILPPILDIFDTAYNESLLLKDRLSTAFIPSLNGSNNSLNMIPYHSPSASSSSSTITTSSSSIQHAFIHSHTPNMSLTTMNRNTPTTSKAVMLQRLPSGLLLDSSPGYSSTHLRWRNSSGEPTRPLSIAGGLGPSGEPIVIEGGSYQDSSLGSSLSSLVGRGTDDLAQSIAEAIQDEDLNWSPDKCSNNMQQMSTVSNRGVWQFSVKSTVPSGTVSSTGFRSSVVPAQSILSEADFPSQDTSPSAVDSFSPKCESSEQIISQTVMSSEKLEDENSPSNHNSNNNNNPLGKISQRKRGKKSKVKRRHSSMLEKELNPPNSYPSGYESLGTSPIVQNPLVYSSSSNISAISLPGDVNVNMFNGGGSSSFEEAASNYNAAPPPPPPPTVDDKNANPSNETFQSEEKLNLEEMGCSHESDNEESNQVDDDGVQ
ncbi:unnamed protein product [Trichobilharzia szidati]|nr:unnamed protein product [Trichobilharzia szidati]